VSGIFSPVDLDTVCMRAICRRRCFVSRTHDLLVATNFASSPSQWLNHLDRLQLTYTTVVLGSTASHLLYCSQWAISHWSISTCVRRLNLSIKRTRKRRGKRRGKGTGKDEDGYHIMSLVSNPTPSLNSYPVYSSLLLSLNTSCSRRRCP
jgi:uncharacterized Fe-S radical SAM superfamily protein PflX